MKSSRWLKKLQYESSNICSHSVVPLTNSLFSISINLAPKNMTPHWKRKSRIDSVKRGYRKCLAHVRVEKYLGWFNIYCKNTSLHGFRYISMDGSSIIESVLWFMVCILSIVFCVILMLRLWANYSNNPIVTTIYTSNPIWDVSFPAVTITISHIYMDGFTTNDSDKFFSSLVKLIRPDKISIDNVTARQFLDRLDMTVETLMEQLMQPCSALLLRCVWLGKVYDCSKIFKTIKSKEGFCCTFNYHYNPNVGYM